MAIVMQHDKRTGITYAYESHINWGSKKKMARAKRTLIGKFNPETGEIVPIDSWNRQTNETINKNNEVNKKSDCNNTKIAETQKKDYGYTNRQIKETPQKSGNYRTVYENLLERCEKQKALAEKLRKQLESLGKPLEDIKKHLEGVKIN